MVIIDRKHHDKEDAQPQDDHDDPVEGLGLPQVPYIIACVYESHIGAHCQRYQIELAGESHHKARYKLAEYDAEYGKDIQDHADRIDPEREAEDPLTKESYGLVPEEEIDQKYIQN
jgi:hypothetical protein